MLAVPFGSSQSMENKVFMLLQSFCCLLDFFSSLSLLKPVPHFQSILCSFPPKYNYILIVERPQWTVGGQSEFGNLYLDLGSAATYELFYVSG